MVEPLRIEHKPERFYAVGDIHGCADELSHLLTHLTEKEGLTQNDILIFIGDYVDRGPNSKGVIDQLLDIRSHFPSTIFLKGNHEDMLLSFLGFSGRMGIAYLQNGGDKTLKSYGIAKAKFGKDVLEEFPPSHTQFLMGLTPYAIFEEYIFAHAGLSPIRPLADQSESDLYWIREEFIHNIHRFEKTIVFGHTPFQDVLFHLPYKLGIDTGLVFGNKLTCVELVGKKICQIRKGEKLVSERDFPL